MGSVPVNGPDERVLPMNSKLLCYICPYRLTSSRKSGYHLGTKASKIIIVFSLLICENSVLARLFTVQDFLIWQIQILFF